MAIMDTSYYNRRWRTIAVYSVVVSSCMSILSIFALAIYDCSYPDLLLTDEITNVFLVYFAYFFNWKCLPIEGAIVIMNTEPAIRTHNWAIVYLVLNIFWLLSSLILFRVPSIYNKRSAKFLTYPYILITILTLCCDLAACGMYGADLQSMETYLEYTNFMGINNNLDFGNMYIPLAPILMIIIFSKAIVLWIVDLACVCFIIKYLPKLMKSEDATINLETRAAAPDYYYPASANPAYQDEGEQVRSPQVYERNNYRSQQDIANEIRWKQELQRQQIERQRSPNSPTGSLDGWAEYTGSPSGGPRSPQRVQRGRPTENSRANHGPWTYLPPEQDPRMNYARPYPQNNNNNNQRQQYY